MVTIVTAFFDIHRDTKGDGRTLDEYMSWIQKTLQLNCNLYVVTESKFVPFMKANRTYPMYIHEDTLENASYYKYLPRMKEILESDAYKERIAYPNRVECVLPEYNVIQYSKFGWLEEAIQVNPFQSDHFFWMDAGISRFFGDVDVSLPYPCIVPSNRFIIQKRYDLDTCCMDIWKADNVLKGTMFGGHKDSVLAVSTKVEEMFQSMLSQDNVNNEQIALAMVYHANKELFFIVDDSSVHLPLFTYLSKPIKCILFGNCQCSGVKKFLEFSTFFSIYEMHQFANWEMIQQEQHFPIQLLKEADLVIYQPLTDVHGCYSTNRSNPNSFFHLLKPSCKTISFPRIHNNAIFPVFHKNETSVMYGYVNNHYSSLEELLHLYDTDQLDFDFDQRMKQNYEISLQKEMNCDVKIAHFIYNNISHKLFLTQDHPTSIVFKEVTRQICNLLKIPFIPQPVDENWAGLSDSVYNHPSCQYPISRYAIRHFKFDVQETEEANTFYRNQLIDYDRQSVIYNEHIQGITSILKQFSGYHIEGNLICDISPDNWVHQLNRYKIKNLQNVCKGKKKIIEIGVNACHSLILMLLVNPTAEYVLFDLNIHPYTIPTLEYVKSHFSTKITTYFGNSVQTITQFIQDHPNEWHTFDFCHLDGGHSPEVFSVDYENMKTLLVKDGVVVFDDYDHESIYHFIQEKTNEINTVDHIKTTHFIYTYK